jgi:hypothetical protein
VGPRTIPDHDDPHRPHTLGPPQGRSPPLVPDPGPHDPRGSQRCRGPQPCAAAPGGVCPPGRGGDLRLPAARVADADADLGHCPRRTERRGRQRTADARPGAVRALQRHTPARDLRRQPLPCDGPQGPPQRPGPDARGGHHPTDDRVHLQPQAVAAESVPDPDQVPRRGPPPGRPASLPRVHHEGRLLLPYAPRRRGRSQRDLRQDVHGLLEHLPALRPGLHRGRGRVRAHRRLGLARVHGQLRVRRGHGAQVPRVGLRGQC